MIALPRDPDVVVSVYAQKEKHRFNKNDTLTRTHFLKIGFQTKFLNLIYVWGHAVA
jgi:hypothetical protein